MTGNDRISILFVDDEPYVISALRRWAVMCHEPWEVRFATNGPEALRLLSEKPADVVVSDRLMPVMTGDELLARVRAEHPGTVRIVLSGHLDEKTGGNGLAHQVIVKPFDATRLKETIRGACRLRRILNTEKVISVISRLPAAVREPQCHAWLLDCLLKSPPDWEGAGKLIVGDPVLSGFVLRATNASFFRPGRETLDVPKAMRLLGAETVRAIVVQGDLLAEVSAELKPRIDWACRHSLQVGRLASEIATLASPERRIADESFTAGLLHELGEILCLIGLPEEWKLMEKTMALEGITRSIAEERILGASHGIIGAGLLGLWGFPLNVVEAVAFHHEPGRLDGDFFRPVTAVHAADELCGERLPASPDRIPQLDYDYLRRLGLADRLPLWTELAKQCCGEET